MSADSFSREGTRQKYSSHSGRDDAPTNGDVNAIAATPSLNLFRGRDLVILFLLALTIYTVMDSRDFQFSISPAWYKNMPSAAAMLRGKNPNRSQRVLSPIVGDIDGDGMNELILITNDMELQILSVEGWDSAMRQPKVLATKKLSEYTIQQGQYPVAMEIGYIDPYDTAHERSQVIIVVTEDFTVSCFDRFLNVLWEKRVAHNTHDIDKFIDLYATEEVAVFPSSLSVQNSTGGTVFVGVRMKGLMADSKLRVKSEDGMYNEGDAAVDINIRSKLEHFNMYALSGLDGHVLWKHDGLEVKAEQYTKSLPQSSTFKQELQDLMTRSHRGAGMNDWTLFRQSLIAQLPHQWHRAEDTYFEIANFARSHIGLSQRETVSGANANRNVKDSYNFQKGGKLSGLVNKVVPSSAALPHDASEHLEHPNVLVAHTSRGIEVVSLATGSTITSLALERGNAYVDLDGDSVVDSVLILENQASASSSGSLFADAGREFRHCSVVTVSGLPASSQLFNGTLCPSRNSLSDPLSHHKSGSSHLPSRISAAPSVFLSADGGRSEYVATTGSAASSSGGGSSAASAKANLPGGVSGTASSSSRRSAIRDGVPVGERRNVVIAINTGIISSFDSKGVMLWQIKNGPTWKDEFTASALSFDVDSSSVGGLGSRNLKGSHFLVAGDSSIALFSREGSLMASFEVPNAPVLQPVIADFDGDGVNDIIVVTENAVLGYKLVVTASTSGLLIAVVILAVIALLVFVAQIRRDVTLSAINSPAGRKKMMTLIRSTDNLHVD